MNHGADGAAGQGAGSTPRQGRGGRVEAALLFIGGLALARLVGAEDLGRYLRGSFTPLIGASALLLGALGLWTLLANPSDPSGGGAHHHASSSRLALLVPFLLILLLLPSPLGASSLDAAGAPAPRLRSAAAISAHELERDAAGNIVFPGLSPDSVNEVDLDELVERALLGAPEQLLHHRIRVIGFAVANGDAPEGGTAGDRGANGGWMLARYRIICCAADAVPFLIELEGEPSSVTADQWYALEGEVVRVGGAQDGPGADSRPLLRITRATPIDAPEEPYL